MPTFSKGLVVFLLSVAACFPLAAQSPLSQILQPAAAPSTAANIPTDALGRSTPYGTVFGFLQAAQEGNYSIAAQYLQMSAARRQTEGVTLATKDKEVRDREDDSRMKDV